MAAGTHVAGENFVMFRLTFFLKLIHLFFFFIIHCGRQEEPAVLISRLLLRMRRMYVASVRLDFH